MDFSHYGEASEEWTTYIYTSGTAIRAAHDREKLAASGLEGKFTTRDYKVATRDGWSIPLRVYTPGGVYFSKRLPIYIYFHGGGFLHGSVDTEGIVCASIATKLGMMVIHPCPRHVHEAKHPTIHHDAWDAINWILDRADSLGGDLSNIVVGGVSSGANLAATVTQKFSTLGKNGHGAVRLKGQVLALPWLMQPDAFPYHLFADAKKTSLVQCSDSLGLPTVRLEWLSSILEAADISDPLLNPPLADDNVLRSLPKTAIIVAGGDPLRDEGLLYATRLKELGIPTKVNVFPGMPHHFIVYELPHHHVSYDLPSAKIYQTRLLESIRWALADGEDEVDVLWNTESLSQS